MSTPVETFQVDWELRHLLETFEILRPRRILEVGAWHGGTLWHWLRWADHVVVVDDEMRKADEWQQWADDGLAELYLLQGDSRDPELVAKAQELGPYDFVFIDGDHRYEAVRADWANFSPMARVVAFHDILPRPGYGVSELWSEVKATPGARYMEICQNETLPGNEGPCGIGILWT